MKVFLSYALPQYDNALPARLRAMALAYDVELLLPNANERQNITSDTKQKIKKSQAVIALVTENAPQVQAVNFELQEANNQGKPVIALVESYGLIQNIQEDRVVLVNRFNPSQHETRLVQVLELITANEKRGKELVATLTGLGLIALGLYAFGELTKD
jgi:hypothetical protein